jgi:hypothetical protein
MRTKNTTIHPEATVGELVVQQPNRSRLLEELGIDYCCGGRKPLRQVCEQKGIALDYVMSQLEELAPGKLSASHDAAPSLSLTELIEHIVNEHHTYPSSGSFPPRQRRTEGYLILPAPGHTFPVECLGRQTALPFYMTRVARPFSRFAVPVGAGGFPAAVRQCPAANPSG